ncbi:MAG: hypothetical protein WDZ63_00385 [Burkholderiales bacterium]
MQSHRGEPLRALASVQTQPGEEIRSECLALGDEHDAPDPDFPMLREARLSLSDTGDTIELSTQTPVTSPTVSVVLRVQCPGQPYIARQFNIQLPPRVAAIRIGDTPRGPGTNLKTAAGETPESIARVMIPRDRKAQRDLAQAIIHTNPALFPDRRSRRLPPSATLFIPDLRTVRKILAAAPPLPIAAAPTTRPQPPAAPATAPESAAPRAADAPEPPAPAKRVTPPRLVLRLSSHELDLRFSEGMTESKRAELRRSFRGEPARVARPAATTQAPDAAVLELRLAELRATQSTMDAQLKTLEEAVDGLRKAIVAFNPRPGPAAAPRPAPRPEPRPAPQPAIAREEMPWLLWGILAVVAVMVIAGAFRLGRRIQARNLMREHEQRIDTLLDEARAAAGPLFTGDSPEPTVPERERLPKPAARAKERPPAAPPGPADKPDVLSQPAPPAVAAPDTQPQTAAGVDLELDSGADAQAAERLAVSTNLRQEMDEALDNSRSMFTDVDRFIALGRTQNAISLLEFQVHKDPDDRDSWIKLMAIYRQEAMDEEFERAHREFKQRFSDDGPA